MTRRILTAVAAFFSVSIALASYRFLALGLNDAFPEMVIHLDTARLAFVGHIVAAPIALATAVFQLMPRLRARRPALHRTMGRVYGLAILVAGLSALVMALNPNGGLLASLGFGALAILWIGFTTIGITRARAKDFTAHRRWMIRSFALTFAAVTLRLELIPLTIMGMSYDEAITWLAYLSWLPNLAVAEWVLRRTPRLSAAPA